MSKDLSASLQDVIRPDVRAMHAYHVQDATGYIKLDAMENPFALPQALQDALGRRLGALALNRYPGTRINDLKEALRRHAQVPDGYGLILGNGSDEIISLLAMACARPGATVLAPEPGFVMYGMSAKLQGLDYVGVPLTPDFNLDATAMVDAVAQYKPAITYIAYPNNPTANLWDDEDIEEVVQAVAAEQCGFVVIDEAYQPFAAKSYHDRLTRYPHVLLMRTLSKFGLAGVRLGYLVGPQAVVDQIDKVRPPYNVSVLNCETALFALEHEAEFQHQAKLIRQERERLLNSLDTIAGAQAFPSEANMILVRVPDAAKVFAFLKEKGILIKNVANMHELLANCVRLTVGLPQENDALVSALREALNAN